MEAFSPKMYFLIPVHDKYLAPPSSTPGGDKDMGLLSFLLEI